MRKQQMTLSNKPATAVCKQEEQLLIALEQDAIARFPRLDALALKEIGLANDEIAVVQMYYCKARCRDFKVHQHTTSECLRALIRSLKYLPRTDHTGHISVQSYKQSDNLYSHDGSSTQWSDKFRYEFGRAVIHSFKEHIKPRLLDVLWKVYTWIVVFQKEHGLFDDLPPWMEDGMTGDFTTDNWVGSGLYEGKEQSADRVHACEHMKTCVQDDNVPASVPGAHQLTLAAVSGERSHLYQVKGGDEEEMEVLRIKIDIDKAKATKKGYFTAYINDSKGDNQSAPDYKGTGVAVWKSEMASLETTQKAAEAGAGDPVPETA